MLKPGDGVVAALANVVAVVAVPSTFTDHHTGFLGEIQQASQGADAAAEQDVEFGDAEGWSHLVFGHLDLGANAVFLRGALEGLHAADVETHRGIELQRITTGGGFRVAVGDADLEPELVEEDHRATGLADVAGDLAHRLAHQTGLSAHSQITHLPFNLSAGSQRCHRVDHHQIDSR